MVHYFPRAVKSQLLIHLIFPHFNFCSHFLNVFHFRKGLRNFHYVLQTYEYDRSEYGGPPAPVDKSEIEALFGSWADVTEIDRSALDRSCIKAMSPSYPDTVWEVTLLIKPKTSKQ